MKSSDFIHGSDVAWEAAGERVARQIMGYDERLMMVKVAFEQGSTGEVHTHPHSQASYIAEGKFEVTLGERTMALAEGDGFYVEPGLPHGVKCLEKGLIIDMFSPAREDFLKQ
ncbi:MAG: cupin domain-containing protein [Rikenellaceae bacterium]|jgi:quercetin dioxygenase-like cupin family protein|nr:cupin domain-containing protein [Rikenellaceae bacterium]